MNREEVINVLTTIEQNHPVSEWTYGSIEVWPIAKQMVFFQWYNGLKSINAQGKNKRKPGNRFSLGGLVSALKIISKVKKADVLYSGAASHRVLWQNQFVNRYFYPELIEKEDFLFLEYGLINPDGNYDHLDKTIFLEDLNPLFLIIRKLISKKKLYLPDENLVIKKLNQFLVLDENQFKLSLTNRLRHIDSMQMILNRLLKKIKPQLVKSLCYYNQDMFALHGVTSQLLIPNFDMQHGGQGPLHAMYTFESQCANLNTIPSGFYCWDEASASHIREWKDPKSVIITGNPWINFILAQEHSHTFSDKMILYTLQDNHLEDYIIDAIKDSSKDIQWWIRPHPRMQDTKENILKQFEKAGINSNEVEIDLASELPLPIILSNSQLHLSNYSGSILESAQINVPSIILSEVGIETYKDLIDEKKAIGYTEKNSTKLLNLIEEMLSDSN